MRDVCVYQSVYIRFSCKWFKGGSHLVGDSHNHIGAERDKGRGGEGRGKKLVYTISQLARLASLEGKVGNHIKVVRVRLSIQTLFGIRRAWTLQIGIRCSKDDRVDHWTR